ncbi:MAG: hypothetical protein PVJ27_01150 [Candidatus Brocadiaceae bacterium]|jgi:uncharacterized paraquat-inducible protein A
MAKDSGKSRSDRLVCPRCKKEFLTYSQGRTPVCPRCGKPVRTLRQRHLMRLLAVAILATLIVLGVVLYLSHR